MVSQDEEVGVMMIYKCICNGGEIILSEDLIMVTSNEGSRSYDDI